MSDPQRLEQELREYLETEPNLRRADRLTYLKTIFNKHLEINKLEHVINSYDFGEILSGAKNNFSNMRVPRHITKRLLDGSEITHVAVIESFVSYLNKKDLLKKLVKFDYTD